MFPNDCSLIYLWEKLLHENNNLHQQPTHVALINQRVKDMIAARYSVEDEIKMIRTAPSEEFDIYNDFSEACRQWGRDQKALIGL